MTSEELDLYFSSPTGGHNDIWVARRTLTSDPWGSGTLVTELSSPQNDEDPEVSVDGLNMFFSSDRGGDGMHLYVARRRTRDTPWEQPVRVDGLGSSTLDLAPAVDRAQLYLVFASQRGDRVGPSPLRGDASRRVRRLAERRGAHGPELHLARHRSRAVRAGTRVDLRFAADGASGKDRSISNRPLRRQLAVRLARRPDR